jgi:hypothetical protein
LTKLSTVAKALSTSKALVPATRFPEFGPSQQVPEARSVNGVAIGMVD